MSGGRQAENQRLARAVVANIAARSEPRHTTYEGRVTAVTPDSVLVDVGGVTQRVLRGGLSVAEGQTAVIERGGVAGRGRLLEVRTDDLAEVRGVAKGGTGLAALGAAKTLLRVNAAGNALEYTDTPDLTSARLRGDYTGSLFSTAALDVAGDITFGRGSQVDGSINSGATLGRLVIYSRDPSTGASGERGYIAAVNTSGNSWNGNAVNEDMRWDLVAIRDRTNEVRFSFNPDGSAVFPGIMDLAGDTLRLRTSRTPASAAAAGNAGDICRDSNYIYVCVASSTWKRVAISTW